MGQTTSDLTRRNAQLLLSSAKTSQALWKSACKIFQSEFLAASQKVVDATEAHDVARQRVDELKAALAAAEQEAKDTRQALHTAVEHKAAVYNVIWDSGMTAWEIEAEILDSSKFLGITTAIDTKLETAFASIVGETGVTAACGSAVVLSDGEGEQVEGQ